MINTLPTATLTKATRLLAKPPQWLTASHHRSSEVSSTYLPFSFLLLMPLNTPHHARATAVWNVDHEHALRKNIRPSLLKRGAEKEPCQAWGCPVGLFLLQAAEDVYSSDSSAASSSWVVLLGKESNLSWWCALLSTLKHSSLSPREVGHISTLSQWTRDWFDLLYLRGFHQQLIYVTVIYGSVWELDDHATIALDPNSHNLMCSSHQINRTT